MLAFQPGPSGPTVPDSVSRELKVRANSSEELKLAIETSVSVIERLPVKRSRDPGPTGVVASVGPPSLRFTAASFGALDRCPPALRSKTARIWIDPPSLRSLLVAWASLK